MAQNWELSRGEAEFLVDVLESLPEEKQWTGMSFLGHERADDMATELRMMFGMEVTKERLQRLLDWQAAGIKTMAG